MADEGCLTLVKFGRKGWTESDEDLKAELERLCNENAALKRESYSGGIRLKVSEKGARLSLRTGAVSCDPI